MERHEFVSFMKEINDAKIPSVHHLDDVESIHSIDIQKVDEGLDTDKHRWYEITTTVYKAGDWFFGIRGPSQLYSESSSWEDLYIECKAFEMEEVQTTTYKKK